MRYSTSYRKTLVQAKINTINCINKIDNFGIGSDIEKITEYNIL